MTDRNKEEYLEIINNLNASGSTNLQESIESAM